MSELVSPRWAWIAVGAVAVGGLVTVAVVNARAPAYNVLIRRTGAPKQLATFAALQRYTESRGNPKAGLGRPELFPRWAEPRNAPREQQLHEADAAAKAYDRNVKSLSESPYPRRMWIFGSGGPYGMIPAFAVSPWFGTDALRAGRVGPYDVFSPWKSTVFFVDFVRRLINQSQFRELPKRSRNWLAIKRGFAAPSLMADYEELKTRSRTVRRKTTEAAEALGIPEDFLYEPVPMDWRHYKGAKELIP